MNNLQNDELQLKRLKLKLGINRLLNKWGRAYASNLACQLQATDDLDFYNSVVDEMEAQGMLKREIGGRGALILVYREITEVPSCPNS